MKWWKHKGEDEYLVELNRQHAALVNNHMHHDLIGMPEVERQTAIADTKELIQEEITYRRFPWQKKLDNITGSD